MIKFYTGAMFAGKSTALFDEYNKIEDKQNIICFKPSKDIRDFGKIKARNIQQQITAIIIKNFEDILKHIKDTTKYIFIDEIQFIKGDYKILTELSLQGRTIITAGLSMTSELKPFGSAPNIIAVADEIIVLKAVCNECGDDAFYTYCKENKNGDILVGNKKYEPLCQKCYMRRMGW